MNKSEWLLAVIFLFFLCACQPKKTSETVATALPDSGRVQKIDVQVADTAFRCIEHVLESEGYIVLSQQPVINDVVRVILYQDRIYLLDKSSQLICYDFEGRVKYQAEGPGGGPHEFGRLIDFCIDPAAECLVGLDRAKRKLIMYDLLTGKYRSEVALSEQAPMKVARIAGRWVYDNPDHRNFPDKKDMHYSLLYSADGRTVDKRFFPHDAIADYDFDLEDGHPFFYNNDRLFYNVRFDNKVYAIEPEGPRAVYEIDLPDPLPLSEIERKIHPYDLMKSHYSCGLSDIFQCGRILYFWFSKGGYFQSAFYDLEAGRMVYCGKQVDHFPSEKLLVYYPIRGVYGNCFFSLAEPSAIIRNREKRPDVFPEELMKITESDNPVIFFYRPVR